MLRPPFADPRVRALTDSAPADWLHLFGTELSYTVANLVPAGYEASARILHETWLGDGWLSWADMAARTGVTLRPDTGYSEFFDGDRSAGWREGPNTDIPAHQFARVAALLPRFTGSTTSFFAIWVGYGTLDEVASATIAFPSDAIPERQYRTYFLFEAPIDALGAASSADLFIPPTLWWPEDRRWFFHCEIDTQSSVVAGDRACIASLVAADLGALEATPDLLTS